MPARAASLQFRPVTGAIGAEVAGIDLSAPLAPATIGELYAAWLRYQVLFFRDQKLDVDQLKRFAAHFGDFEVLPFLRPAPDGDPAVSTFSYEDNPYAPPVTALHIDVSYSTTPSKGAVLYCSEVDEYGGDTIWVNTCAAFEALSLPMQRLLEGLTALHPVLHHGLVDRIVSEGPKAMEAAYKFVKQPPAVHPLVRRHPETGRKALFVDTLRTWRIPELTPPESRALLDFLFQHVTNPEFQCRFHWRPGSLAIWDNRCTMHRRVADVARMNRAMNRIGLVEKPPASEAAKIS
jgi:taurine dioxygenase